MSKKIKKLLSGLLALAMVASSGAAVFADEPTAAPAAEATATATEAPAAEATATATEAPAAETATEAPAAEEATEAPATPVPDKYAADAYYQKALTLCKSLGVITGYDDGSVKPESTVTRAEMAAIILRMTATESTSVYRNIFDDVTTAHWAADTIQTAADANVVNGMGDGTFAPDGEVLYEQAVKMVVCGMNYQAESEAKGGYPEGYLAVATVNLGLLNGVKGERNAAIERGEIIKMVYNALLGPYHKITSYVNGNPVYDLDDDESLAKAKFDVVEAKGLLTGTPRTAITATKPAEGQITIDDDTYLCSLPDVDSYVANKITYYYVDNNKQDPEVVAITTNASKTTETNIDAADIEKIKDINSADGKIETENGKTYKLDNPYIIYNGDLIDSVGYTAAAKADSSSRFNKILKDGTNTGEKLSFEEFITPEAGSLRLVDNDGDGKYDVVFITSVETLLITAATDKRVIGKIKNSAVTLDVDTAENADLTITVTKDGEPAKPKNLKKNEVVSVTRNIEQDIITFEQVAETITGKIQSLTAGTETENAYVRINGDEYEVDINAVGECTTGLEVTAYLDKFGRIGYVESDTLISASEKYGWILSTYLSDSGDNYMARIFSQDGSVENYKFADKVTFWGPNDKEAQSGLDSTALKDKLRGMTYNTTTVGLNNVDIRLVKYGTNAKGEISKMYFATAVEPGVEKGSEFSSTEYDKKALVMENTNMNGAVASGNLISKSGYAGSYFMSDGMIEFTVPNDNELMNDTSTYAVNKDVKASQYLDKENGIAKDFIVGEYSDGKQTYPTVVVKFVGSSDNPKLVTDYGTADNNPCFMLEKIYSGVDADDNTVYTLVGYQNGGQVKYTTKKNTLVAKLAGNFADNGRGDSGRTYNATELWDGINGMNAGGKELYPGAKQLTDVLGEGDILGVGGGGDVLILMVDASELAEKVKDGGLDDAAYTGASSSRDSIYIGRVSDSELGESAVMSVAGKKLLFDPGRAMDTVMIDEAGHVDFSAEDVSTIADVMDFNDEYSTGDYAFVRYAAKGALQEVFLFRFDG